MPPLKEPRDTFWRALEERTGDPAFLQRLENEFPSQIEAITDPVARRTFLKLMGASLALAGITGCTRQPAEVIVPYVKQPEEIVPGKPLFFATSMTVGGIANGLLVESHEGRPTKVEGNALHPGSLGATDVFGQASVLNLYDPDRPRALTHVGEIQAWPSFIGAMHDAMTAQQQVGGAGVRLLTESIGSPTLADQVADLLRRYPKAKWHQWDPAARQTSRLGARLAFGRDVDPQYRLDAADVVVALDADLLGAGPGGLRYARDYATRRRPEAPDRMNRLYAIESMPSSTGSRADHRFAARPSEIPGVARALASAIGGAGVAAGVQAPPGWDARVAAIARDLAAHRGAGLVVAGESQPPFVHALAHAMNAALGNVGHTVVYTEPVEARPVDQVASLSELVADMNAGQVSLLVILGGNPVYTAPADVPLTAALDKVAVRIHLTPLDNETSAYCHWQIPEAHFLEAWSDARAYDGTASIVQPLIAPLYEAKSAHEVLAALGEHPEQSAYDLIRAHWMGAAAIGSPTADANGLPTPAFESAWRKWLNDGVIPDTAFPPVETSVDLDAVARAAAAAPATPPQGLEIAFRPDPSVLDGRFSNNGWLQELPKPVTRLTWDNAVIVSPATAARLGLPNALANTGGEHGQIIGDIVEIRSQGRSVEGAAFAVPGHPDECLTVHLGYGRTRGGEVAVGHGFDASRLRRSTALWSDSGVELAKTGRTFPLACVQYHHLMEGRGMVRALTLEEFVSHPEAVHEGFEEPAKTITLYPEHEYTGYKWGMAIDVNSCIGCNACVVACQSENNIAVVGKDQVLKGREMHWIRIDTYYRGETAAPETYFQPVPCMQCENAPCEVVCPVGATVHSSEGLNDMVYNRCVGTRYCSNNCPYKVRRFNFLLYQDWNTPQLKLGRNPDVTVRSRGVMEKCTYCVQRINEAKIGAEKEDRAVRDGEIRTACEAVCPTSAIVFGDLNDPGSRVARLKAEQRNYAMLAELNTRPRTTYLAAIRNPNPELEG